MLTLLEFLINILNGNKIAECHSFTQEKCRVYQRILNIFKLLEKKSFFLFGPRQTGKSTLIRQNTDEKRVFDLLDHNIYAALSKNPNLLEQQSQSNDLIVIDEIQKLPILLDEVHRLIESRNQRFLLTGSSARKLRRGAANLLAGRAWRADLFPLSSAEIDDFDLLTYLNTGGLPAIYGQAEAKEELNSYVNLYLREEIVAEALVRRLEPFQAFLDVMGHSNGQELNKVSIAEDAGIPARTVTHYLEVLYDTLVAYELPAFTKSRKRKAITRSKFYFFDLGVAGMLAKRGEILDDSELLGPAFEHFIINEIRAYQSYHRTHGSLHYWRTKTGFEVDVIIDGKIAVEIKATKAATDKHLRGLKALREEGICDKLYLVSRDPEPRFLEKEGIHILPWESFVQKLWQGSIT